MIVRMFGQHAAACRATNCPASILTDAAEVLGHIFSIGCDEHLSVWLEKGWLMNCVAAEYPLERIAEAHEVVEQGRVVGNVVVKP